MYSLNPSNGKIKQLQAKEDVISDYSIANQAFEMVYFGLSASNSQRLYTYNLKNDASSCLIDLSKEILRDVTLGECKIGISFPPKGIRFTAASISLLILTQLRNIR